MKRIFVCSPFQGKQENLERAKMYCRYVVQEGHAPFAPHLLFPQFLDDADPDSREKGIWAGISYLRTCDEVWVFGETASTLPTPGMAKELEAAKILGVPTVTCTEASVRFRLKGKF
jgi:hypothetical protein